jgi:hypothetical protein
LPRAIPPELVIRKAPAKWKRDQAAFGTLARSSLTAARWRIGRIFISVRF